MTVMAVQVMPRAPLGHWLAIQKISAAPMASATIRIGYQQRQPIEGMAETGQHAGRLVGNQSQRGTAGRQGNQSPDGGRTVLPQRQRVFDPGRWIAGRRR